jgi:hypothetical protein
VVVRIDIHPSPCLRFADYRARHNIRWLIAWRRSIFAVRHRYRSPLDFHPLDQQRMQVFKIDGGLFRWHTAFPHSCQSIAVSE